MIDWNLIVGYTLDEARDALADENQSYHVQYTVPPKKQVDESVDETEVRVVGIRQDSNSLMLICATVDWSVS